MTMVERVLSQLYDDQPIFVDKLGGTRELTMITERLYQLTRANWRESEVLSMLITLRKAGKLQSKVEKREKVAEKPTWPKAVDGTMTVYVPINVGYSRVVAIIDRMSVLPTSRQEVYDFLMSYPGTIQTYEDYSEQSYTTATRLFPELT